MIVKLKMNLRLILRFESDSPFSSYFFSLFFTARIKKRGEEGGKEEEEFFISFFFPRKEKKKQGCFWRHWEKLCDAAQFLSLSLSLFSPPSFLSPPTTTFLFSPSPLNALRRRLNSSFPPPFLLPLRAICGWPTFLQRSSTPVSFFPTLPFPSIFFFLFFFFFTGSMFLFLFHGRRVGGRRWGGGEGGQTSARVTSGRFVGRERSKSLEGWIFDFSRWIRFLFPFFPFLLP